MFPSLYLCDPASNSNPIPKGQGVIKSKQFIFFPDTFHNQTMHGTSMSDPSMSDPCCLLVPTHFEKPFIPRKGGTIH